VSLAVTGAALAVGSLVALLLQRRAHAAEVIRSARFFPRSSLVPRVAARGAGFTVELGGSF